MGLQSITQNGRNDLNQDCVIQTLWVSLWLIIFGSILVLGKRDLWDHTNYDSCLTGGMYRIDLLFNFKELIKAY